MPVIVEAGLGMCMRRVLVISHTFPPSLEVGAMSCAQIARYLPNYGWEPTVLTVREQYIDERAEASSEGFDGTVIRTGTLPHVLRLYKWAKQWVRSETVALNGKGELCEDGRGTGGLRRWVLSLLMVPDQHTGWIIPAVVSGLKAIRQEEVCHLFSTAPYWTNHLVGLILAQLTGLCWTAHFRDPWSQSPAVKPISALSSALDGLLEKAVVGRASAVVCVTEAHTALMQKTYPGLPPGKFSTISNGFDGAEWDALMSASDAATPTPGKEFVITYAGSFYADRNPLPLFRAVRVLADSGELDQGRIHIQLIGDCAIAQGRGVKEMAAACGLGERISMPGLLDRAETVHRIVQSDLLLVLAEGWVYQIPAKTYEYLRAGRPILALTSSGALASFLKTTGGAWVVDPNDQAGVTAAVREAYQDWMEGRPGRTADRQVIARFDRRVLAGRFAEVFDRCATRVDAPTQVRA